METSKKITKFSLLLLILLLIIAGGLFLYNKKDFLKIHPASQNAPIVAVTPVEKGKLPEGITTDMILEQNPDIIQNYTATNSKGDKQSTLQYVSKNMSQKNFQDYLLYLQKNNWATREPQFNSAPNAPLELFAQKNGTQLNVSIFTDKVYNRNVVDITLVTKAK